ncbi:MAG: NAD(+) kinase [Methylococcales bacterium]|nr:NAD(+) kinase [Methylococcales bacterium]
MPDLFPTIGILGKYSEPAIAQTLKLLHALLTRSGRQVIIDHDSAKLLPELPLPRFAPGQLAQNCDLLIAAGGDGTFLAAARAIADTDTPLLGVNLGRLGFLVDISPMQLADKLNAILKGRFTREQRYLLDAQIIRDGRVIHRQTAVNEVVVHRWVTPSMIEIITHIDGVFLNSQRSDGLIVATPTGSTAYSLSAGGPIMHPSLRALLLVPLNPHTLSNRTLVIDDRCEIKISFAQAKQINALVTCDHLEIPEVLISDHILIKKQPKPITILHPEDHDFFHILRAKLNWSGGYPVIDHADAPDHS